MIRPGWTWAAGTKNDHEAGFVQRARDMPVYNVFACLICLLSVPPVRTLGSVTVGYSTYTLLAAAAAPPPTVLPPAASTPQGPDADAASYTCTSDPTSLEANSTLAHMPSRRHWEAVAAALSGLDASALPGRDVWFGLRTWNVTANSTGSSSRTAFNLTWADGSQGGHVAWSVDFTRLGPSSPASGAVLRTSEPLVLMGTVEVPRSQHAAATLCRRKWALRHRSCWQAHTRNRV